MTWRAMSAGPCRAEVSADDNPNKFYVTDANTSEKVVKSEQIEQIRTVIIQNMIKYHPEAAEVWLIALRAAHVPTLQLFDWFKPMISPNQVEPAPVLHLSYGGQPDPQARHPRKVSGVGMSGCRGQKVSRGN